MPDTFFSAAFTELFAKIIAETCIDVYKEWRGKRTELVIPSVHSDRVREAVRSCVLQASHNRSDLFKIDSARQFLAGPDFEFIAAGMVASSILGASDGRSGQAVRQCQQAMRLYGATPAMAAEFSSEFESLLDEILKVAVPKPSALAQFPPSGWNVEEDEEEKRRQEEEEKRRQEEMVRQDAARRYLQEQSERQISERLALLTDLIDHESLDLSRIRDDIQRLRTAISQVNSIAASTHLEISSNIPVENIYVGPIVECGQETYIIPADVNKLFERASRVVLLGDPGGGKTSLAKFLAYIAASSVKLVDTELTFPLTLREHSAEIFRSSGLDIVEAIQSTASSHFQVELTRSEIRYLCQTGRLFLVLDGLDELIELRDRTALVSSISAFAALHPKCPIFATSRIIGYEQAPLDPAFALAKILPFDEERVSEYAKKWFGQSKDLNIQSRDSLAASFLEESSSLSDLRSNPLLLSLMCSLYRHKRYIPKNRAQLYGKCAELLFDDWDRSRRLRQKFEFDARIDGAIRHLAYWIFSDQKRQSGVLESIIRNEVTYYFNDWIYGDLELASQAARSFLSFCKNRAWILTETGTAEGGEGLFQFVHRTFLEYFTAAYIVNKFSDIEICNLVASHASEAPWHVVCQIIVQLASKKQQGLEDRIIEQLSPAILGMAPIEKRIALALCVRVLEGVSLRPATVRTIAEQAIGEFVIELRKAPIGGVLADQPIKDRGSLWLDSERIAVENLRAATPIVLRQVNQCMESSTGPQRELAHLLEFELTSDCTPETMAAALNIENRIRLQRIMSGKAWEAWLECAALLVQLDNFTVRPMKGMTIGNVRGDKISSVSSRWGNRPLPNGLEIVVWLMAWGNESIIDNLERYALAGLGHLATVSPTMPYDPHLIWQSSQDVESVSVKYSSRYLRVGVCSALSLIEHSLGSCSSENELAELASSYASKPWGALWILRDMVEARYLGGRNLSRSACTVIDSIGLTDWCKLNGPRLVHLTSSTDT